MNFPAPTNQSFSLLRTSDGRPITDQTVLDMLRDLVDADAAGTRMYATYHREAVRRGLIEGAQL